MASALLTDSHAWRSAIDNYIAVRFLFAQVVIDVPSGVS